MSGFTGAGYSRAVPQALAARVERANADGRASPARRTERVIEHCAHPHYKPMLQDEFDRVRRDGPVRHTPHLMGEALSWHERLVETGTCCRATEPDHP